MKGKMMSKHLIKAATILATVTLMGACATNDGRNDDYPLMSESQSQSHPYSVAYGVIDSIQVSHAEGKTTGAGAVVGGVVGGILGNQIGGGVGNTAATVAGAAGGALVGNRVERSRKTEEVYQIGVRLRDGGYQTVSQSDVGNLHIGDRVQIENGHIRRY